MRCEIDWNEDLLFEIVFVELLDWSDRSPPDDDCECDDASGSVINTIRGDAHSEDEETDNNCGDMSAAESSKHC